MKYHALDMFVIFEKKTQQNLKFKIWLQQTTIFVTSFLISEKYKEWHFMRILFWHMILMKYHALFVKGVLFQDYALFVIFEKSSKFWNLKSWLQQTTNLVTSFLILDKDKEWYFMRIVCWQTILKKYHALFVIFEKNIKIWNLKSWLQQKTNIATSFLIKKKKKKRMIFQENLLLADDSHEISCLVIFEKSRLIWNLKSWLQQMTNFAASFLILEKIRNDI